MSQKSPPSTADVNSRNFVTKPAKMGNPASENIAADITIARNGDREASPA